MSQLIDETIVEVDVARGEGIHQKHLADDGVTVLGRDRRTFPFVILSLGAGLTASRAKNLPIAFRSCAVIFPSGAASGSDFLLVILSFP